MLLINTNEISSADTQLYGQGSSTRIYFQDGSFMEVKESLEDLLRLEREAMTTWPPSTSIRLSKAELRVN